VLSSILFIALIEVYQLFLFSTLGLIFYHPSSPAQVEIVRVLGGELARGQIEQLVDELILFANIIVGRPTAPAPSGSCPSPRKRRPERRAS